MSVEIPLSAGFVTVVDDEDAGWARQWKWCVSRARRTAYATRHLSGSTKMVLMHRALMQAAGDQLIDHRNLDGLDNRRENLRFTTKAGNSANSLKISKAKTSSRFKGVWWNASRKLWEAKTEHHRKQIHLGRFRFEWQAAEAYDRTVLALHGEFALTNAALGLFESEAP